MAETLAVFQKAASLSIAMPMTARRRTVEAWRSPYSASASTIKT
jgi:hypothetical protein